MGCGLREAGECEDGYAEKCKVETKGRWAVGRFNGCSLKDCSDLPEKEDKIKSQTQNSPDLTPSYKV